MRMSVLRLIRNGLAAAALFFCLAPAYAAFQIPGFELVHTVPAATELNNLSIRDPAAVWCEMIDAAKNRIDIEQFYVASKPGSALDEVITHLETAAKRGVRIRFLMEQKGVKLSDPNTLARLRRIAHIDIRFLAYADLTGSGIIHAKFFVVDGNSAYVGSQNFDWRSLEHIDETGLKIDDAHMAGQLQRIFDYDWQAQALLAAGKPVPRIRYTALPSNEASASYLVASPAAFDPPGVENSERALVDLLDHAQHSIRITVMSYAPLGQHKSYYGVIDSAIRAAAQRGVNIQLLVSNWNLTPAKLPYLKSLAVLPNIDVRFVTIPQAPAGFIPYARVVHSKTMTIDGHIAWIGTSNWEGGYFDTSRNVEVVLQNPAMAERLDALHEQLWQSAYTSQLDSGTEYPPPHPGRP